MSEKRQRECFVIAPIGEEHSSTRARSDKLLRHLITPVVTALGYADPVRADQLASPGMITSQVIERIVEDDLVIADLTGANPNVYYELAIRHAVRRPLVQLIEKGEAIPFDVAGARTILVDLTDLDSVDRAKAQLERQIRAAEQNPSAVDNPISMAMDLRILRDSSDPVQRSIATLTDELSGIREDVRAIRHDQGAMERLRPWEAVGAKMDRLEKALKDRASAIYDLDDVMSQLQDLERAIDDLKDAVERDDE